MWINKKLSRYLSFHLKTSGTALSKLSYCIPKAKVYSEPGQTSKMELFTKIVNG